MSDRYIVAGLARARTDWFGRVGRWATEAAIPVEFVRCVSVAELRARLGSGRPFSAVLLAADVPGVDRDLLALAREAGAAPIVIAGDAPRDWLTLGAAAVLPAAFDRQTLVDTLAGAAAPVREVELRGTTGDGGGQRRPRGRLVAVTGPGGTGASTVAIAAAQGLAAGHHDGVGPVLLADLRRVAEQAMIHDSRVVVPGLQELVEAHRAADPSRATIVDGTFAVPSRGYRLLLGLRRPRQWTTLRPRALEAAITGLQRAFGVVVADVDPDVEGEDETGSLDVEERHLASRLTLARADAVVIVGEPTTKGLYSLARLLGDLLTFGVPPERVTTVLNRSSRTTKHRSEMGRALAGLMDGHPGGRTLASPLHLPERKVEAAIRDGVGLPSPLPTLVAEALARSIGTPRSSEVLDAVPVAVTPGSLGIAGSEDVA